MANEFPGTNNLPLLYRDGMFGTRLEGANDAADGRYIFTKMEKLTELLFRKEDEPILERVNDDGDFVQPHFYMPILPMILVNGCVAGIGTGWSSTVPCYNPTDLIKCIRQWMEKKPMDTIKPWYRGFTGAITQTEDGKYTTTGTVTRTDKKVEVSELPIGMWTNKFKDYLDELRISKRIRNVKELFDSGKGMFPIYGRNRF